MKRICVFCGSSSGTNSVYKDAALELGNLIAENNIELVYGGGNVGLMGFIADSVLGKNGKVTGVIPHFLAQKEVGHKGLSKMIFVDSMHERKQKMSELADGFIAMPGGFGTLEELAEILTWAQLGLVTKPIGILNVNGYYDNLLLMLDHMVAETFLKMENRNMLIAKDNSQELLTTMNAFVPSVIPKWITPEET